MMGVEAGVWGVKKYIAVGSETAGSRRLWDGGMFSVHNSPSPHSMSRYIATHKATNKKTYKAEYIIKCTRYCVMCKETHVLYPGDIYRKAAACQQHFLLKGTHQPAGAD